MKRPGFAILSLTALVGAALLVSACAGAPAKAPEPQKQRKERTVTVQVPVLVKETSFYADGLVDEYFVYKYDAGLTVLLGKDSYDASRPDPIERMVTEVEAGRIKAEASLGPDGKLRFRVERSWDSAGRPIAERTFDAKGGLQSSSSYAYDAAGNRVEWKAFDGKGILKATTRYNHENGRLVLIDMRDGSGNRIGTIAVAYDAAGHVVKRSYLAGDGSLQKTEESTWNGALLTSVETKRADGSLLSKTAYAYGELGQVLSSVTTDSSGAVKDKRAFEYSIRQDQKTEVYWE
jgi:YD repeat-containing protein